VAKLLNVPVSLVSVIDTDREFWTAHGGVPPEVLGGEALRESALCASAAGADDVLDVEDISKDSRYSEDAFLSERGIKFYAGVPLRTSDGHVVGALCVTDTKPHQVSERARALLRSLADRLVQEVERRHMEAAL
jgi:GAF domain-containing protein